MRPLSKTCVYTVAVLGERNGSEVKAQMNLAIVAGNCDRQIKNYYKV
ncbi:MAG: hypothetical protein V7K38_03385 [Nostoc sp.]